MGNGTFEEMKITDFKMESVLESTGADDMVRFELQLKKSPVNKFKGEPF
jgi:hypothetical protein